MKASGITYWSWLYRFDTKSLYTNGFRRCIIFSFHRNLAIDCCNLVQSRTLITRDMGFGTGIFVVPVKSRTYKGSSIFDALVPRDSGGKKLPVKSICRGIVIAVIILDKRRSTGMPNGDVGKPARIYAAGGCHFYIV